MTSQQLPERANLEQLKKQAKSLLHGARSKESSALQRFQALPALARNSLAELGAMGLALHDANLPWSEFGDAPLHVAAQRWDVSMVELLVQHGADIHQRRADGRTAHTLAELHGNQDIAAWLLARGAKDELTPLERFVSACASGYRTRAEAMLQAQPTLRGELRAEHHLMMQVPAERGDSVILETMLVCGFDPDVKDHDGVTTLHKAAMAGRADAVRVLLEYGASVNALDGMFAATPLVWASEGCSHGSSQPGVDYPGVARRLIAGGSSLEWIPPEKAPHPELTQEQLIELCRAAGQGAN